jgi:hypothetical protein
MGWLKLKRAAEGSRNSTSHRAQWKRLENRRRLPVRSTRTSVCPGQNGRPARRPRQTASRSNQRAQPDAILKQRQGSVDFNLPNALQPGAGDPRIHRTSPSISNRVVALAGNQPQGFAQGKAWRSRPDRNVTRSASRPGCSASSSSQTPPRRLFADRLAAISAVQGVPDANQKSLA